MESLLDDSPIARKGRENEKDPKGIYEDMKRLEDYTAETLTGNLQDGYWNKDAKGKREMWTQVGIGNGKTCKASQTDTATDRGLGNVWTDDNGLITSGAYMTVKAGRRATNTTCVIGNTVRGEDEWDRLEEGSFCSAGDLRIKKGNTEA